MLTDLSLGQSSVRPNMRSAGARGGEEEHLSVITEGS